MPLKPWYKVVTPREDLREGKPLDASEFAVHLDDGAVKDVYSFTAGPAITALVKWQIDTVGCYAADFHGSHSILALEAPNPC